MDVEDELQCIANWSSVVDQNYARAYQKYQSVLN